MMFFVVDVFFVHEGGKDAIQIPTISGHHWPSCEMPFEWSFAGGPVMANRTPCPPPPPSGFTHEMKVQTKHIVRLGNFFMFFVVCLPFSENSFRNII